MATGAFYDTAEVAHLPYIKHALAGTLAKEHIEAPFSRFNLLGFVYGLDAETPFDWIHGSMVPMTKMMPFNYALGAVYVVGIVWWLQRRMSTRKEVKIPVWVLAGWNWLLALFSFLGAIHTVPQAVESLMVRGLDESLCDSSIMFTSTAFWVFWFDVSKGPEFVDTLFLRLRKRPVILLHWYHHIMTFAFCIGANQTVGVSDGSGWYFAAMNLTVHSIMYSYYALAAMGYRRAMQKMGADIFITTIQITQMALGLLILAGTSDCERVNVTMWYAGLFMYTSYFVLFGKLFADKYLKSPPPKNPLYKAAKKAATLQGGAANGKASVNGNGKASARASKDDKKHK